jgi:hypothetical protein
MAILTRKEQITECITVLKATTKVYNFSQTVSPSGLDVVMYTWPGVEGWHTENELCTEGLRLIVRAYTSKH